MAQASSPGAGPWRITFDTNPDDCNMACIMCEQHSEYQRALKSQSRAPPRHMDIRLLQRVVVEGQALGCLREIIPSTMGEPLLYADFDAIVASCRAAGVALNLTTNGTFPRRSVHAWARFILPVASDVKISWNGSTAAVCDAIMKPASFDRRLGHVQDFIALRDEIARETGHYCRLTFQVTFMERNFADLPALLHLAARLGIDRVKGHHLWVHHPGMAGESLRRDAASIARWNHFVATLPALQSSLLTPNGAKILLENFNPLAETGAPCPANYFCPFLGQEAWVAWDGRFNPCCAPDALRLQLGDFGNLASDSLGTIWHSKRYQDLCARYLQHSLCQECGMRRPPVACVSSLGGAGTCVSHSLPEESA